VILSAIIDHHLRSKSRASIKKIEKIEKICCIPLPGKAINGVKTKFWQNKQDQDSHRLLK
jgi:hypothetical protein